jgi:hypothetical protein
MIGRASAGGSQGDQWRARDFRTAGNIAQSPGPDTAIHAGHEQA